MRDREVVAVNVRQAKAPKLNEPIAHRNIMAGCCRPIRLDMVCDLLGDPIHVSWTTVRGLCLFSSHCDRERLATP